MNINLINGNNLYGAVISQHVQKDFLLLSEVPEMHGLNRYKFHLEYSASFSGALLMDHKQSTSCCTGTFF
jgi:hypothetical protein